MGRCVTRSTAKSGCNSQESGSPKSNSEHILTSTQSGRVSKKKKRAMANQDSLVANLDDSVLSLSLEDPQFSPSSQEACSSGLHDKSRDLSQGQGTAARSTSGSECDTRPECSICLQNALHPVKLPCNHIFCFLCIKGAVHNGTNSCALCRAPIPRNYIFHPDVIGEPSQSVEQIEEESSDKWYYEGRNSGWWEYDPRTAEAIEAKYNDSESSEPKVLELMIAGFIYIIDLEAMVQMRKDRPNIQRRIKRDRDIADKRGVAGIVNSQNRKHRDPRRGTPV